MQSKTINYPSNGKQSTVLFYVITSLLSRCWKKTKNVFPSKRNSLQKPFEWIHLVLWRIRNRISSKRMKKNERWIRNSLVGCSFAFDEDTVTDRVINIRVRNGRETGFCWPCYSFLSFNRFNVFFVCLVFFSNGSSTRRPQRFSKETATETIRSRDVTFRRFHQWRASFCLASRNPTQIVADWRVFFSRFLVCAPVCF